MADQTKTQKPVTTLLIGLGGSGAWTVIHTKRQLYDAYNNRLPPNVSLVVLDTAKVPIVGFGAETSDRKPGDGVGRTVLDRAEIAHVGGEALSLVREVDKTNNYPHIKSWFLSSRFLADLPEASFALDQGAGQFRQFGRLALFRDVLAPSTSSVSAIIDNKLRDMNKHQTPDSPAISVVITGSLAGGTGAGLFIDIAHLVRKVAEINNINITLRAFLYLPQAFRASLNPAELEPARARAFAALRELKRFILNSNYEYGYPMHYHGPQSGVNQQLWRGANTGKLYDFVYLIDGEGQAKLNSRKLEEGSASAVADAIVNFIDENYGPKHEQYLVNVRGKIQDRQSAVGKKAFISTLGAYSIIMPIQQIIEGWAYRLSREILLNILPAGNYNDRGYMSSVSMTDNPDQAANQARDEVQRLSKSLPPVTDPNNEQRQLLPLPLWGKVFDIAISADTQQSQLRRLGGYELMDWLEMLVPPTSQTDPDVLRVLQMTAKVIQDDVEEHVDTSDDREGGDPSQDWQDIRARAERFTNAQLGMPASGGGRQGGQYRESLSQLTRFQVQRFREYTTAYIHHQLNGSDRRDMLKAKAGKLGWLIGVFREFRDLMSETHSLLMQVRAGSASASNRRADIEDSLMSELKNMQEKRDKRGFMGIGFGESVAAQKSYISAVREYIDYYRMEFSRDEVASAINGIVKFIEEILTELQLWARVLGVDVDSLHNKLLDGARSVDADRERASRLANHRVIDDKTWESSRYDEYVTAEVRDRLLRAWTWKSELVTVAQDTTKFSLISGLETQGNGWVEFRKDVQRNSSKWVEDNLKAILELTRQEFRSAVKQESLLAYLMNQHDAKTLATELNANSGYLLSFDRNERTSGLIPGYILLAKHDDTQPAQSEYLREVSHALSAFKNLGDTKDLDNPMQIVESCADAFRVTLLSTAELIPMEGTDAYENCMKKYWEVPYDVRQKNHIFPAEVHAVEYERALQSSLEQPNRLLSERVILLLEDEKKFTDFLLLLTHRMIEPNQIDDGTIKYYWALFAPTADARRKGQMEEWHLSGLINDFPPLPALMDAAVSYVITGHDVRNEAREIPNAHILEMLKFKQDSDTAERLDQDEVA